MKSEYELSFRFMKVGLFYDQRKVTIKVRLSAWLKEHAPVTGVKINDPVMSLGTAANITGLSESALRKYEATGLIIFHRNDANRRMVSLEDIERIRMIQNLIKKQGLNSEGILRLWTLFPCWELKGCSTEERKDCPAMVDSQRPCWILLENKGCMGEPDCRTCEVYRFGAYCTEDLKSIIRKSFSPKKNQTNKG